MLARANLRGFTLVEMLVSTAVLVLGVYTIYHQFTDTARPSQERLLMAQARSLAHGELEKLRAAPADALLAWNPEPKFSPHPDHLQFWTKPEISRTPEGAIQIFVTVGWNPTDSSGQEFPEGRTVTVKGINAP
jgi:prepilin-type N-terminal cleavage/methylation domain-containing protein